MDTQPAAPLIRLDCLAVRIRKGKCTLRDLASLAVFAMVLGISSTAAVSAIVTIEALQIRLKKASKAARLRAYLPIQSDVEEMFVYVFNISRRSLVMMDWYSDFIGPLITHCAFRVARLRSPFLNLSEASKSLVELVRGAQSSYCMVTNYAAEQAEDTGNFLYESGHNGMLDVHYCKTATTVSDKCTDAFLHVNMTAAFEHLLTTVADLGYTEEVAQDTWECMRLLRVWLTIVQMKMTTLQSMTVAELH